MQPTQTATNPYDLSAQHYRRAGEQVDNLASADTSVLGSMNQYLNPYYQQVIENTTRRLNQQNDRNLNQVGAQASAAGAFGGSRHGLLEAELYDNTQQQVGDITAQLMAQRFDTAAGLGQQDIQNKFQFGMGAAQGYGQLGAEYMGIGNGITDRQMQQGSMQQQLLQQILDAGSGMYSNFINSPNQAIGLMQALMSSDPRNAAQTQTSTQPGRNGFMDLLSLGAQVGGAYLGGPAFAASQAARI